MARTNGCDDRDLVRQCALACACAHSEAFLWNWSYGVSTSQDSSGLKKATDIVRGTNRQFTALRKDLLVRAVDICMINFSAATSSIFSNTSWGSTIVVVPYASPRAPQVTEPEGVTAQLLDISDSMADALDALRRQLRLAVATLGSLIAGGTGEVLTAKFVRSCCAAVNALLLKGLMSSKKRTVNARGAKQFSLDVSTVVALLSEFYSQADLLLAPIIAACHVLETGTLPPTQQHHGLQPALDPSLIAVLKTFRV
jgi:hypothetical protein